MWRCLIWGCCCDWQGIKPCWFWRINSIRKCSKKHHKQYPFNRSSYCTLVSPMETSWLHSMKLPWSFIWGLSLCLSRGQKLFRRSAFRFATFRKWKTDVHLREYCFSRFMTGELVALVATSECRCKNLIWRTSWLPLIPEVPTYLYLPLREYTARLRCSPFQLLMKISPRE